MGSLKLCSRAGAVPSLVGEQVVMEQAPRPRRRCAGPRNSISARRPRGGFGMPVRYAAVVSACRFGMPGTFATSFGADAEEERQAADHEADPDADGVKRRQWCGRGGDVEADGAGGGDGGVGADRSEGGLSRGCGGCDDRRRARTTRSSSGRRKASVRSPYRSSDPLWHDVQAVGSCSELAECVLRLSARVRSRWLTRWPRTTGSRALVLVSLVLLEGGRKVTIDGMRGFAEQMELSW